MAIVKMKKFTLLAFESQKQKLLKDLQRLESVQFSEVLIQEELEEYLQKDSAHIEISEIEEDQAKIRFAIDFLSQYEEKKGMIQSLKEGKNTVTYYELEKAVEDLQWKKQYNYLKEKESTINKKKQHISKLSSEIEEIGKWSNLDISMNEVNNFKNCIAYLGVVPKNFIDNLREDISFQYNNCYIEVVNEDNRDSNILIIFHKELQSEIETLLKRYSFSRVNYDYEVPPKEVIRNFKTKIKELKSELENIKKEIEEHVKYINDFKLIYEYNENHLLRLESCNNFLRSKNILTIEGWLPEETIDKFEEAISKILNNEYYLELEDAKGEDVPILLKNGAVSEAFEPITEMYSMPRYNEIDPTPLFMPFYFIFFGMMLSDAGYGLVMFIGSLVALKFFNLDEDKRKSIKMFFYLSISTIFWGVMYGSYFGDAIKISPIWMKPDSNVILLMIVSVALGLIQIYVGLGIKGYMLVRDGKPLDALLDVGLWYLTLTGGILWLLSASGALSSLSSSGNIPTIAKYATFGGMILILLTHGRSEKGIGAKLGAGLYSLYGITGYVGDLVSYTRLAALGLATGFIGSAFNLMIGMLGNPIAKILAGSLIFVVGHLFNLFINALGAYVHTCRLQYLEYFNKFYEGGGKTFRPLKFSSKYVKVVKD
ncbi:V-type ATPase [Clostridium argentinense CDC 2741]|uniref:V-type ATPase n=2 Tax=Clostridium argentinense TaxID=29341 RepID=A0A0C1ULS7_9CLOT|nr:V-type ATP synthase subunit I [Clostridium argentinense]ARC85121.1 V-type ATP synthase subunit I [Clostridium argentinense]KIE48190.1 V-type ATPase [Clostridium argentinense CDC 2741]NFF39579.1 V-type ATP synthase subunit I [Clostridium argentinense]NFP51316.1 V-type ATP synthase subunit I [Clostridium argentinense]NFP72766.1 V-type ATP synthase subunit I [Clostridium argentinense]